MNTYVAFLRGINVGGNNKIQMSELVVAFTELGFTSVRTYINSGNVIFCSVLNKEQVEPLIIKALSAKFGYSARLFIRSQAEISQTIQHFPKVFTDPAWKHNIIFLSAQINSPEILKHFKLKPDLEQNSYYDGVLYWSALWEHGTRAIMYKLSTREEYQEMTVRSIGTIKKILAIMQTNQ